MITRRRPRAPRSLRSSTSTAATLLSGRSVVAGRALHRPHAIAGGRRDAAISTRAPPGVSSSGAQPASASQRRDQDGPHGAAIAARTRATAASGSSSSSSTHHAAQPLVLHVEPDGLARDRARRRMPGTSARRAALAAVERLLHLGGAEAPPPERRGARAPGIAPPGLRAAPSPWSSFRARPLRRRRRRPVTRNSRPRTSRASSRRRGAAPHLVVARVARPGASRPSRARAGG